MRDDDDPSDRLLVRPYVQPAAEPKVSSIHTEEVPGEPPEPGPGEQDTAVLPAVTAPSAPDADRSAADGPDPDGPDPDGSDRRMVLWLVGAGLALILVAAVAVIALWPGGDDNTPAALPGASVSPAGVPSPTAASAGTPSPSAKTSASASASATPKPTGSPTAAGSPPAAPPGKAPPSPTATLAPPPAADRVGVITGGGHCLDILGGLALPGMVVSSYACNGSPSQRWTLAADGTLRDGGMCAIADDSVVRLGDCGASAQWRAGGGGAVVNVSTAQCLTDPANGSKTGGRMTVAACGGAGQGWALP